MKKIIAMLGAVVITAAQANALNVITYYDAEEEDCNKWTTYCKEFKNQKEFLRKMDELWDDEDAQLCQVFYKDKKVFDVEDGTFSEDMPKYIKENLLDWYGCETVEEFKEEEWDETPEEEQGNAEEIMRLRKEIYGEQ